MRLIRTSLIEWGKMDNPIFMLVFVDYRQTSIDISLAEINIIKYFSFSQRI